MTVNVQIPRIEDEIERAWKSYLDSEPDLTLPGGDRKVFEAGFRAARTWTPVSGHAL